MNIKGETAGLDLDTLASALQDAMSNANRTLARDQESALRRIIDIGEDGEPEYITWLCSVPSHDGEEQRYEMLRMSISALMSSDVMDIAELSVELDCEVKNPRQKAEIDSTGPRELIPLAKKKRQGVSTRHVKIILRGPDGSEGEVRVEGSHPEPGQLSITESTERKKGIEEVQHGSFKGHLLPYLCHLFHVFTSFLWKFVRRWHRPL